MLAPLPESPGQSRICCAHHQYSSRLSPFHAKTGTPRGSSAVPSGPTTTAAAAWSCVEKMLQEAQRTSAPSAFSVSMSTAVWMVICSDPAMRAPLSGWRDAYSARIAISAGISDSAMAISLRPHSASARSATRKSENFLSTTAAFMIDGPLLSLLQKAKAPAPFPVRARLYLAEPDPLRTARGRNAPQRGAIISGIFEGDQPHAGRHRGVVMALDTPRLRRQGAAHR